jgi:hypothetical protein
MLPMPRFIFHLPHVAFEREWVLGPVMFRPAGALLAEVQSLPDYTAQVKNYGVALDHVRELATAWAADATVEVETDDGDRAVERAGDLNEGSTHRISAANRSADGLSEVPCAVWPILAAMSLYQGL